MRQGEIWFANLDPVKGSEQSGMRPVVIISGNTLNDAASYRYRCPRHVKDKIVSYLRHIEGGQDERIKEGF